jgi:hypothetical protein
VIFGIDSNGLGEEIDSFIVILRGEGFIALIFQSIYLSMRADGLISTLRD